MKLVALLFLGLVYPAAAQQSVQFEKTVRYRETVAGQKIEVTIHQREMDFTGFKVTGGEGTGEPAKLNGVTIGGTDGQSPAKLAGWPRIPTIAEIELKWNGKTIPVPKKLHVNLLSLSLRDDTIQFVPRPSGEELLIQATGGDGGASYLVSLVLRRNGKHKQYEPVYNEGGLPPHPYKIEDWAGSDGDGEGDSGPGTFNWLQAKTGPEGKAKEAKPGDDAASLKIPAIGINYITPKTEAAIKALKVGMREEEVIKLLKPVSLDSGRVTWGGTGCGRLYFKISHTQQLQVDIDGTKGFVVSGIGKPEPLQIWTRDSSGELIVKEPVKLPDP